MPHGFKFQFGIQHVGENNPKSISAWWLVLVVAATAAFTFGLTKGMTNYATTAHVSPVSTWPPSPYTTPSPYTPTPRPAPTPSPQPSVRVIKEIKITGSTGAICVLPSGLPSGSLEVVKVP